MGYKCIKDRLNRFFSVSCKKCDEHFAKCRSCPTSINYFPSYHSHVIDTSILISDLELATNYVIKVRIRYAYLVWTNAVSRSELLIEK